MKTILLCIFAFTLALACEPMSPQSQQAAHDKAEEEKAIKEGTQPPDPDPSELKLRITWDQSNDQSIVSYRVSRVDESKNTLVKEWTPEAATSGSKMAVEIALDQALSPSADEETVCFVLTAVNEFGESDPTQKSCLDLSTEDDDDDNKEEADAVPATQSPDTSDAYYRN